MIYDAIFDHPESELRSIDRCGLWTVRAVALAVMAAVLFAATAGAQMPNAPLLQNAWATAGLVGAIDVGGGPDGSVYAGAVSWTPKNGRFELSGGLGFENRQGLGARAGYGLRAAIPFGGASSSLGFAAFAGIGGMGGGSSRDTTAADSLVNTTEIPVGAAIGWRHAVGGSHGVSLFATPAYVFYTGGAKSSGLFRVGLGGDFGITPSFGATAGIEFGGTRAREFGGPSGVLYGVGLSYAVGHR
jgi:hypothetical protein